MSYLQAYHVWLIVGLLLFLGEMLTGWFIFLWFGIGAGVAAFFAFLDTSLNVQLVSFGLASLLLFAASRTIFHRFFMRDRGGLKTNIDSMVGRDAEVVEPVGPGTRAGTVKVGGEVWTALSTGEAHGPGEKVIIAAVDGLKLRVSAASELPNNGTGGDNK